MTGPEEDPMEDDGEYGLVMPFLCVQSAGGPFDDHAFVEGVRYAMVQNHLDLIPDAVVAFTYQVYADPAMAEQYDLLAMHHDCTSSSEPWDEHPDEWALVTITRELPDGDAD